MSCLSSPRLIHALALLALAACSAKPPGADQAESIGSAVPAPMEASTAHYAIKSTAGEDVTRRAGHALEALHDSYAEFFADVGPSGASSPLRVRLYRDRNEFRANSRSRPWAEAYYADGVCHAYLDQEKSNPYHWLLHEAVHQLNRELRGIARERWINEGLATYFGSSRYADGRLEPGVPDMDAYPLWWLERWELSGDWATDVANQRVIPLRTLITGEGEPSLDAAVNAHYLGWWSLTHFLLHHEGGRYAAGFRSVIVQGGSLANFEHLVGPIEQIEAEWYRYFQQQVRSRRDGTTNAP